MIGSDFVHHQTHLFIQCFNVEFPDCHVYFDLDSKFKAWADRLPPEYRLDCDPRLLLQEYNASQLKVMAQQRYLLHTWFLAGRLKLHVTSTTGLGRAPQAPSDIRQSMEQCVIISIDIIHLQSKTYKTLFGGVKHEDSPYFYPGSSWLFDGCFSLFEASVALITTMAQLRWQEKSAEAAIAVELALHTFSEVVRREEGKTRETAVRAFEVLTTIRNQASRTSNTNSPKIKPEPELLDFSVLVHMNKTVGDTSVMASVYASAPHLNTNQHTGDFNEQQLPRLSRLFDLSEFNYDMDSENVAIGGMGDQGHMNLSHVGVERGAIRHS